MVKRKGIQTLCKCTKQAQEGVAVHREQERESEKAKVGEGFSEFVAGYLIVGLVRLLLSLLVSSGSVSTPAPPTRR